MHGSGSVGFIKLTLTLSLSLSLSFSLSPHYNIYCSSRYSLHTCTIFSCIGLASSSSVAGALADWSCQQWEYVSNLSGADVVCDFFQMLRSLHIPKWTDGHVSLSTKNHGLRSCSTRTCRCRARCRFGEILPHYGQNGKTSGCFNP